MVAFFPAVFLTTENFFLVWSSSMTIKDWSLAETSFSWYSLCIIWMSQMGCSGTDFLAISYKMYSGAYPCTIALFKVCAEIFLHFISWWKDLPFTWFSRWEMNSSQKENLRSFPRYKEFSTYKHCSQSSYSPDNLWNIKTSWLCNLPLFKCLFGNISICFFYH